MLKCLVLLSRMTHFFFKCEIYNPFHSLRQQTVHIYSSSAILILCYCLNHNIQWKWNKLTLTSTWVSVKWKWKEGRKEISAFWQPELVAPFHEVLLGQNKSSKLCNFPHLPCCITWGGCLISTLILFQYQKKVQFVKKFTWKRKRINSLVKHVFLELRNTCM